MTRYWFRPKRYGYGATPVAWEGWALIFGTVLAMVVVSLGLRRETRNGWGLAALILFDIAALALGRRPQSTELNED